MFAPDLSSAAGTSPTYALPQQPAQENLTNLLERSRKTAAQALAQEGQLLEILSRLSGSPTEGRGILAATEQNPDKEGLVRQLERARSETEATLLRCSDIIDKIRSLTS